MDDGKNYGVNIDGDGRDGRLFGCPQIIWSAEQAEAKFPARKRKRRNATREQDISRTEYRLVVGESGNEQGHVVPCRATTEIGAKRCLGRELAEYQGDGWGYIECREAGQDTTCWRSL